MRNFAVKITPSVAVSSQPFDSTGVMFNLYNIIPIPYFKIIICLHIVKVFQGNTDYTTAVGHILDHPIIARFIKINVKTYQGYPSLRVELYGCSDGMCNFFGLRWTLVYLLSVSILFDRSNYVCV